MSTQRPPSDVLASWRAFADKAFATMDQRSYYALMGLAPDADATAIRAAYYKLSAQLHPDHFIQLPDATLRDRLESIYARINEAHRVLSSPEKRALYDKQLAAGKMRFDAKAAEKEATPRNPEDGIKNADAKRFFRMGMICLGRNDVKGAIMNFNFARTYEPQNQVINEMLAKAQSTAPGAK